MLIPLTDYKVSVFHCQVLRTAEFLNFEADGLPQLDGVPDVEHGFAGTFPDMDVNGPVIVAVKEEPEPVPSEDRGHGPMIYEATVATIGPTSPTASSCARVPMIGPGSTALTRWSPGEPLEGVWYNRTKEWAARQRNLEFGLCLHRRVR